MSAQYPGPSTSSTLPGPAPMSGAPAQKKGSWLPWGLGCGCTGLVALAIAAVLVIAFVIVTRVSPEQGAASDPSSSASASPTVDPSTSAAPSESSSASPSADTTSSPAPSTGAGIGTGTTVVQTERLTFSIPSRWVESDLSNQTLVRGDSFTAFSNRHWTWLENADDPMPREIARYQFYGELPEPSQERINLEDAAAAIDEGIANIENATPDELLELVYTEGHGCYSEAALASPVERISKDRLEGFALTFDCVGSVTGVLGLRGMYVFFIDEYGDRHILAFTTDTANFDAKAAEFDAVVESFQAR